MTYCRNHRRRRALLRALRAHVRPGKGTNERKKVGREDGMGECGGVAGRGDGGGGDNVDAWTDVGYKGTVVRWE